MIKGSARKRAGLFFVELIGKSFVGAVLVLAALFPLVSCTGSAPAREADKKDSGAGESVPRELVLPELIPGSDVTGDDLDEHPAPGELVFLAEDPPLLEAAAGVGDLSGESRDRSSALGRAEKEALSASFRAAYVDALLRGHELAGVLGGDKVHGWPENDPSGWVQNWRTRAVRENSWGIPSLILAVQSVEILKEMAQDRVFLVRGDVLNQYGKSGGINRANGDRGYGSPRGEEFFYNGSIAQRFELGLIVTDAEGEGRFIAEEPPSEGKVPPKETGVFLSPPSGYGSHIRDAFLSAWKMALDRNIEEMIPDGEGYYISFESFADTSRAQSGVHGTVNGLYVQLFNSGTVMLLLPDAEGLPPHVRLVTYPFLEALLFTDRYTLPGTEGLTPLEIKSNAGGSLGERLMRGLSLYGLPLSDPMPKRAASAGQEQGSEQGLWQEAQRYSRGWIMSEAFVPRPAK